jgi:hypothetical protein
MMNLHCVWRRFELIRRLGPSRLTSVLLRDLGLILNNTENEEYRFLNDMNYFLPSWCLNTFKKFIFWKSRHCLER